MKRVDSIFVISSSNATFTVGFLREGKRLIWRKPGKFSRNRLEYNLLVLHQERSPAIFFGERGPCLHWNMIKIIPDKEGQDGGDYISPVHWRLSLNIIETFEIEIGDVKEDDKGSESNNKA